MARLRSSGPTAAKLRSLSSAYMRSALFKEMRCLLPAHAAGCLQVCLLMRHPGGPMTAP